MTHRRRQRSTSVRRRDLDFEKILADARPMIRSIIRSIRFRNPVLDGDELEQIAAISIFKTLPTWDGSRSSFASFVGRAVRGDLLNAIKKYRDRPPSQTLDDACEAVHGIADDSSQAAIEDADETAVYMRELTNRDRRLLKQIAAGISYKEIATRMKLTKDGVHSAVQRARRKLRALKASRTPGAE